MPLPRNVSNRPRSVAPHRHRWVPDVERLEGRRLLTVVIQLYGSYTLESYAGVGFRENDVATMQAQVDGQPDTNPGDFQATLNWGDGKTSKGDLVYQSSSAGFAKFLIKGSHVYSAAGTQVPVKLTVTGPQGSTASFAPNDIDHADVAAMPSGIAGTQPASSGSAAPETVVVQPFGSSTLTSYAGVGFVENVVGTVQIQVNGQADPNLSDIHAQVNWGDAATWDTADLVYLGSSAGFARFQIKGSHVYAKTQTSTPIVVYVAGPDGTSATLRPNDVDHADVNAMPSGIPGTSPGLGKSGTPANVVVQPFGSSTLTTYAGVGFVENVIGTVQIQVNGQADTNLSDIHARVNWGDAAAWDTADLVYLGSAAGFSRFQIKGSHVYAKTQTSTPIVVYVAGPDGTSATLRTNDVDHADVLAMASGIPGTPPPGGKTGTPQNVSLQLYGSYTLTAKAGVAFQDQEVATFQAQVQAQADTNPGDFQAQVNWGDSASWSPGTLVYSGTSAGIARYTILAGHTYQTAGTNIPILVSVSGPDGTSATFYPNDLDHANVSAGASTRGTTLRLVEGRDSGPVAVASITPAAGGSAPRTASITWGDNSASTTGTVMAAASGSYEVVGDHTYRNAGTYAITVTVSDPDGPVAPISSTALVTADVLTGQGETVVGLVGKPQGTVVLAVFQDSAGNLPAAEYRAAVYWQGSSQPATGTIVPMGAGLAVEDVPPVFRKVGTYPARVLISERTDTSQVTLVAYDQIVAKGKLTLTGRVDSSTQVTIGFNPIGADHYVLASARSSAAPTDVPKTAYATISSDAQPSGTTITGLQPGTIYTFRVVAALGGGKTTTAFLQVRTADTAHAGARVTATQLRTTTGLNAGDPSDATLESYATALNTYLNTYAINNPARVAAFLGESVEETASLRTLTEGFPITNRVALFKNYLIKQYGPASGNYRPDIIVPVKKTAENASRVISGGTVKGKAIYYDPDGPNYYGRGFLQLTGSGNYQSASNALFPTDTSQLVNDPGSVSSDVDLAAHTAGWYWQAHTLRGDSNVLADKLTVADFQTITKNVNGGLTAEATREGDYRRALTALFFDLRPGEILNAIGTTKVSNLATLLAALRKPSNAVGQTVTLTVTSSTGHQFQRVVVVGGQLLTGI